MPDKEQTQEEVEPLINEEDAEQLEDGQSNDDKSSGDEGKGEAKLDLNNLPTEVESHFRNKYADYDNLKARVGQFDQLISNPNFQKWYQEQINPKSQAAPELTDEQYAALISNKEAFAKYVSETAARQAETLFAPKIQQANTQVEVMKRQFEIEKFASDNPDFWELDKKGLIEPVIRKYPNLSIADVYKLASKETVETKAVQRAHNIVQNKKRAIVEKPSGFNRSSSKVTANSREEYMQAVWDAAKNGREIPEWDRS